MSTLLGTLNSSDASTLDDQGKLISKFFEKKLAVSILSERAAREWSTVVDIYTKPPSFKLVSLSSPRSPLSKTPKQVIFLTLSTFCHLLHTL